MNFISILKRKVIKRGQPSIEVADSQTRQSTWVPPGHFYSPIVDPEDPIVVRTLASFGTDSLPCNDDLCMDEPGMLALLETLSPLCADIPFPDTQSDKYRYYFKNPAFSYGDASVYFGMIRWLQPRRIIEVGCGFSSCLAMDTNDLFFDRSMSLTFIEPFPESY